MKLTEYQRNFGKIVQSHPEWGAKGRVAAAIANTKHGKRSSSEYNVWRGIKQRCLNPNDRAYRLYGGRGIGVCDRWRTSFENFIADMGPRPSLLYSVDRYPNQNGNYEPGNCRWATDEQQGRNRINNRLLEWRGHLRTCSEWAELSGLSKTTICDRLRRGWTPERILTEPAKLGARPSKFTGYPGVAYHKKTNKYFAHVGRGKERRYVGSFDTAEAAAARIGSEPSVRIA